MKTTVGFCMTCGQIRRPDGRWVGGPESEKIKRESTLSHTYCEDCYAILVASMDVDEAREEGRTVR